MKMTSLMKSRIIDPELCVGEYGLCCPYRLSYSFLSGSVAPVVPQTGAGAQYLLERNSPHLSSDRPNLQPDISIG
jgi:hypothetical protein